MLAVSSGAVSGVPAEVEIRAALTRLRYCNETDTCDVIFEPRRNNIGEWAIFPIAWYRKQMERPHRPVFAHMKLCASHRTSLRVWPCQA